MAFENKTVESVYKLIVAGLEQELNVKFRLLPKSFIRVLAKVLAGVYITLYKQQAWMFLQMFVDTATFDEIEVLGRKIRPLVMWGELVGVGEPSEATQWAGKARVKVTAVRTYLEEGSQLRNAATGKIYITTETKFLANMEEVIAVKCAEAGTVGNLVTGDELQFVSPLYNVERKALVTEVNNEAVDAESAETYRGRVRQRWRVQPQGGSLSDYRKWASEVPGVYQTYIYKDEETSAGVLIYVAADPAVSSDRKPPKDVLVAVGEACSFNPETGEARKPIGAVLDPLLDGSYSNIRPVSVTEFSVYISGYDENAEFSDFKEMAKSNISAYFNGREPFIRGLSIDAERVDKINVNNVIGICNDIAESLRGSFSDVIIKKNEEVISTYQLGQGEMCTCKSVFINGVEV